LTRPASGRTQPPSDRTQAFKFLDWNYGQSRIPVSAGHPLMPGGSRFDTASCSGLLLKISGDTMLSIQLRVLSAVDLTHLTLGKLFKASIIRDGSASNALLAYDLTSVKPARCHPPPELH
jgi:hypothetical protein